MPEFESIIPNETGDFFEEDNFLSLAITIKKYIGLNKEKRDCYRNNCYRIIDEKYNPNKQIKTMKCLLKSR